jgi:hypothetical protein
MQDNERFPSSIVSDSRWHCSGLKRKAFSMTVKKRLRAIKDRRSFWYRRHRELAAAFLGDLGSDLSAADHTYADHAASVAVECERLKVAQLNGEPVNVETLVRLTNCLTRIRIEIGKRGERTKRDPVAEAWAAAQDGWSPGSTIEE